MPDENTDQFEHNFIYSVEFDDFSDEIMEKYELLDKNINKRLNARINLISELNAKIISIVKKLGLRYEGEIDGVTFDEANNFNNNMTEEETDQPEFEGIILPDTSNLTIENLNEIKSQLERLEILKFQKLDEIIEKTQQEISHLNNIGYISDFEKHRFFTTLKNCRSKEETLERLEERVATLNTHIQDNEELFNLANKWQTSFEEFKALEERQKDSSRLNNRGGALLAETKKRKKLESIMRKTESKLIKLSEDLGENCTRLRGLSVADFLEEELSLYEQEKEMEKQGRKMEKKKAIFQESMFGASVITSQVKRGRHQNNAASSKKSKPADISKSCSISSKGSSVVSGSSSTFRKPLNNRTPQTAQRKPNLKPTQTPKSAQPRAVSGFKKPRGKENMQPATERSERSGRTMAKNSTNRLIPQSPSYRVGPSKPSHVLEAEKIRRNIEKRRSRTPETLKKTKNTLTSRFRQLPSQSIKSGADSNSNSNFSRFGFRRRSKSQTNVNDIGMRIQLEKVTEENHDEDFMSESLVSQEKFNTELNNKSSNNNNFASVNFASSFIGGTP